MIQIYADFNARDQEGRVLLHVAGSEVDLAKHRDVLKPGLSVILHQPGELEVEAILEFDGIWMAIPNWDTAKYFS